MKTHKVISNIEGKRAFEPIYFDEPQVLTESLWLARTNTGEQILCQRLADQPAPQEATRFVTTLSFEDEASFTLDEPVESGEGITKGPGTEADSWARVNTGYFDIDVCTGTAEGTGASKWGLKHFRTLDEGIDLLPSGNNAIGGFYGPFFTPENGLINPPEHTKVKIEILEDGPVLLSFRMLGVIPDGLLPELRGKNFSIEWAFTYRTPWFSRRYHVDDFQTVINGRSVTNKITVGDEFEAGQGKLLFDRFACYGGSRYRSGDPYAGHLADMVEQTISDSTLPQRKKLEEFKAALTDDIENAHWDLYWRLFSTFEGALTDETIRDRLAIVREKSFVDAELRDWRVDSEPIDVQKEEHETIFPGAANKTVEYDTSTGRAMIWYTSKPSGGFQIVQRKQSGWGNWGTNLENECPELPVGVDIKTAYGKFASNWEDIADQLATPPEVL
ncbi:hypothetical protein ACRQF6_01545 [Actinotignum sp. GS-2025f]|uniref:hypothetical protein n=1 Tax=unclassified Actinotignum TaxID=2632702 RepID=UPI002A804404|nr:hypothetical protein [Actinotignum sp. SLA_B059]MDY5127442.1 hypothetical protein [Actinotignum sp. SLA_B059]